MNKKIIAALCGMLVGGAAMASDLGLYVGGEFAYNKLSYSKDLKDYLEANSVTLKNKVPSGTLLVGVKPHENFGAEVGYSIYKKLKFGGTADGKRLKLNDLHVDLLGYIPVDTCFDIIGSFGLSRFNVKNNANNDQDVTGALRFGAGVKYSFDNNFAARAMVRYQKIGAKDDELKNMTSIHLGLTYTI